MNYFANRLMRDERSNPIISCSESDRFPLSVCEHMDGTFSIEWSETDAGTKIFNDWSEEDFIQCIIRGCEDEIVLDIEMNMDSQYGTDPEVKP